MTRRFPLRQSPPGATDWRQTIILPAKAPEAVAARTGMQIYLATRAYSFDGVAWVIAIYGLQDGDDVHWSWAPGRRDECAQIENTNGNTAVDEYDGPVLVLVTACDVVVSASVNGVSIGSIIASSLGAS